jgi:predicted PurR-regulated permease PerM
MSGKDRIYYITLGLTIAGLLGAIMLGLLPALLAGLLVYHIVEFGARLLAPAGILPITGKILLLILLSALVVLGFSLGTVFFASQLTEGPESLVTLLQKMADVVDAGRSYLPLWAQSYLPTNIEEWQVAASQWLRDNASEFKSFGKEAGYFIIHMVFGIVIGGLIAINPGLQDKNGPFGEALGERIGFICEAFRRIVFSQVRISGLNTFLTAIFLAIVLPMLGYTLPLIKTMIAVTFIAGLLPIVGNLISNTVIFLVSLSVAPFVAVLSLIFLVVIHKLEYFINAHIIGTQIRAKAWELLIAMLVMEAAFGVAGLVAAPIYYAYIKDELKARKLI